MFVKETTRPGLKIEYQMNEISSCLVSVYNYVMYFSAETRYIFGGEWLSGAGVYGTSSTL